MVFFAFHIFVDIHVKKAIRGFRALKWWRCQLVPIPQMVSAVKFTETAVTVKKRQWVRIKRGLYEKDLAQVIQTMDQDTVAIVKIVSFLFSSLSMLLPLHDLTSFILAVALGSSY